MEKSSGNDWHPKAKARGDRLRKVGMTPPTVSAAATVRESGVPIRSYSSSSATSGLFVQCSYFFFFNASNFMTTFLEMLSSKLD